MISVTRCALDSVGVAKLTCGDNVLGMFVICFVFVLILFHWLAKKKHLNIRGDVKKQ